MNDKTTAATIAAAAVVAVVVLVFLFKGLVSSFLAFGSENQSDGPVYAASGPKFELRPQGEAEEPTASTDPLDNIDPALAQKIIDFFLKALQSRDAIPGEAILRFKTDQAYRDFLASAKQRGIDVLASLDPLRAVRVSFDKIADLRSDLEGIADDLSAVDGNFLVSVPDIPLETDERTNSTAAVGFGASILEYFGVSGANTNFGQGVRVAVLDSGIAAHPTFDASRISTFDLVDPNFTGAATTDTLGHGTAVASLIAGTHPQAAGLSPAVDLLSYRVTDADGNSDSFTLAQGIVEAADAGAKLINISLGSYGDSPVILDAINYASGRNALVVAAAGNEQLVDAAFPARYDGVVSVGGTDANDQQLWFSNASPSLDFGAPGYELNAAAPDDGLVTFTGTSASAPVVTGAIAAVMSELGISDPYQALDLLQQTANEAGAPGEDAAFGHGVISLERALTTNTRGIADGAVASHYYDADNTFGYGPDQMLFVVENRGTEPLANLPLTVSANGQQFTHVFPSILPNQIGVYPVPVDVNALQGAGAQSYQSRVLYPNQTDARGKNNALSTSLTAPEAN